MKSRLIVAAICVPLLFIVLFFLPPLFTGIVVAGISAMSCWELLTNIAPSLKKRLIIYPTVSAALIPLGVGFDLGVGVAPLVAALLLCVIFAEACLEYERDGLLPFSAIAEMLFAGALMPYFLSTVASLRVLENGRLYVLLPILIAFVADGGAYFAGVFMGKRHIFKKVSPKKTLEGCIGGVVIAVLVTLIYAFILKLCRIEISIVLMAVYAVIGSAATELGDLAFSIIKREHDIKDYGSLLAGHGGMLDRFDSMVFAAPIIYALVMLFPAF